MHMSDLIKLTPIFHEKMRGGRQLETAFGYDIPEGPIGECWAISAPNGDCQIAESPYAGHAVVAVGRAPRALWQLRGQEFPLLIKILDAKDDLSIQIHPNDEYAAKARERQPGPKPGVLVCAGLRASATIVVGQRA